MKSSSKRTLGVIIIVISVLAMAIGVCQIVPIGFADKPCFDDQIRQQEINSDTRIVYCISFYPLRAFGGGIYDEGASNQNEIKVGELNLKRDGQTLFVNNQSINTGKTYKKTHWIPSINPWILFTCRFAIKNEGVTTSVDSSSLTDVLFVSGDVSEGWFINPLGLIILGCGIVLFKQGKKESKQITSSTTKAGYQSVHWT